MLTRGLLIASVRPALVSALSIDHGLRVSGGVSRGAGGGDGVFTRQRLSFAVSSRPVEGSSHQHSPNKRQKYQGNDPAALPLEQLMPKNILGVANPTTTSNIRARTKKRSDSPFAVDVTVKREPQADERPVVHDSGESWSATGPTASYTSTPAAGVEVQDAVEPVAWDQQKQKRAVGKQFKLVVEQLDHDKNSGPRGWTADDRATKKTKAKSAEEDISAATTTETAEAATTTTLAAPQEKITSTAALLKRAAAAPSGDMVPGIKDLDVNAPPSAEQTTSSPPAAAEQAAAAAPAPAPHSSPGPAAGDAATPPPAGGGGTQSQQEPSSDQPEAQPSPALQTDAVINYSTPSCDVYRGVATGSGPGNAEYEVDPVTHYSSYYGATLFPYQESTPEGKEYDVYRCCPKMYEDAQGTLQQVTCGGPSCTDFYGCARDTCPADAGNGIEAGRCAPRNQKKRLCGRYPPPCVIARWPPPTLCGEFFTDALCAETTPGGGGGLHDPKMSRLNKDMETQKCAALPSSSTGGRQPQQGDLPCTIEHAERCCEKVCGPGQGGAGCSECAVGTYSEDGKECVNCPFGTTTKATGAVTKDECNACAAGFGLAPGESSRCTRCEPGSYSEGGSTPASECKPCPSNLVTPHGGATRVEDCTACAPGHGGPTCAPCAPGTFSAGGTQEPDAHGGKNCAPCPAGFTTPHSHAESEHQCSLCAAGHAGEKCEACEVGFFLPEAGEPGGAAGRECQKCKAGFSTTGPGAAACDICGRGRGGPDCAYCEAGTYSSENGTGNCLHCPAGATSMRGATGIGFCHQTCTKDGDCTAGESGGEGFWCWSGLCYDTRRDETCLLPHVQCQATAEGKTWTRGPDGLYADRNFYCPRFDCASVSR